MKKLLVAVCCLGGVLLSAADGLLSAVSVKDGVLEFTVSRKTDVFIRNSERWLRGGVLEQGTHRLLADEKLFSGGVRLEAETTYVPDAAFTPVPLGDAQHLQMFRDTICFFRNGRLQSLDLDGKTVKPPVSVTPGKTSLMWNGSRINGVHPKADILFIGGELLLLHHRAACRITDGTHGIPAPNADVVFPGPGDRTWFRKHWGQFVRMIYDKDEGKYAGGASGSLPHLPLCGFSADRFEGVSILVRRDPSQEDLRPAEKPEYYLQRYFYSGKKILSAPRTVIKGLEQADKAFFSSAGEYLFILADGTLHRWKKQAGSVLEVR